jgi:hypothetical protein
MRNTTGTFYEIKFYINLIALTTLISFAKILINILSTKLQVFILNF